MPVVMRTQAIRQCRISLVAVEVATAFALTRSLSFSLYVN